MSKLQSFWPVDMTVNGYLNILHFRVVFLDGFNRPITFFQTYYGFRGGFGARDRGDNGDAM